MQIFQLMLVILVLNENPCNFYTIIVLREEYMQLLNIGPPRRKGEEEICERDERRGNKWKGRKTKCVRIK